MNRADILILGGGFIGTALANRLAEEGRKVLVLSPAAPKVPLKAPFLQGRLGDAGVLDAVLPQCGTVIHLASVTTPGNSANQPTLELDNLGPGLRLLEALQAYPETHLIYFSSGGTLYGNPQRLPVREDDPVASLSYHGAGKAALEAFLHAFRRRGHAVTILRPSNAYGPGQDIKCGFGLIRTMLEHARCGTPLEIWGDGKNVRDFVYIDDITEACARFVGLPQDSGTYNLGTGQGFSVNQVKSIVEQVTGAELKTIHHEAREIDVRAVVLDVSRLEERLSWKPQIGLEEGVIRTWNWLNQA